MGTIANANVINYALQLQLELEICNSKFVFELINENCDRVVNRQPWFPREELVETAKNLQKTKISRKKYTPKNMA